MQQAKLNLWSCVMEFFMELWVIILEHWLEYFLSSGTSHTVWYQSHSLVPVTVWYQAQSGTGVITVLYMIIARHRMSF